MTGINFMFQNAYYHCFCDVFLQNPNIVADEKKLQKAASNNEYEKGKFLFLFSFFFILFLVVICLFVFFVIS